jgi:hypothetical protein
MMNMKRIAILGSTGSIGRSTLSVAESYPDRFRSWPSPLARTWTRPSSRHTVGGQN